MKLETRHCILCGPEAPKKVKYPANFSAEDFNAAVFSARRLPDRRHLTLVECGHCGLIYSDPAGDPSELAKLYESSVVTYEQQEEQIYDSYAPVLDLALKDLRRKTSFVEIGGGRGFMLRYGREKGFAQQIEIEPSADAEKKFLPGSPGARFIRATFAPGVLPPGSASLVCVFQVLDHIPNPRSFLDQVLELLEPGGAAVAVNHNTQALSARLLGERSPIFDIEHTYLFNPTNLAELFRTVGFERVEAFPVANRYALRYWLHMAPIPSGMKRRALSILTKLRLADQKVKLYAGNVAVIARRPLAGPMQNPRLAGVAA